MRHDDKRPRITPSMMDNIHWLARSAQEDPDLFREVLSEVLDEMTAAERLTFSFNVKRLEEQAHDALARLFSEGLDDDVSALSDPPDASR